MHSLHNIILANIRKSGKVVIGEKWVYTTACGGDSMVCGCQSCGTLMIQDEKGEDSKCICPHCGQSCVVCLGYERPRTKEELAFLFSGYSFDEDDES